MTQVQMRMQKMGDFYGWIVSASMLIYGYSLAMSAAINPKQLMQYYQVQFHQNLMISFYNGLFAIGGMLGSFFSGFFLQITTKRKSIFICVTIIIVSCGISTAPIIGILFASRFLLGFGCSLSTILGGIYIRQTFSDRKRKAMGGVFSLSKMIGSEICIILSYLLTKYQANSIHLFLSLGCGILAVVQLIFAKLILPQIPLYMYMKKQNDELASILSQLYQVQDIPHKMQELQLVSSKLAIPLSTSDELTKKGIITAIYCGLIRQFCGIPYFIVYLSQIFQKMPLPLPSISSLLSTSLRMLVGIIGIWIVCALNRRKLLTLTTIIGCIFCFLASIFDGLQLTNLTIAALIALIIPITSCLQIITWYYPLECSRQVYCKYAAIISWFGMGCLIIIPPYTTAEMANNSCFPILIFFGVFLLVCVYINHAYLVDADGCENQKRVDNIGTNVQLHQKHEDKH